MTLLRTDLAADVVASATLTAVPRRPGVACVRPQFNVPSRGRLTRISQGKRALAPQPNVPRKHEPIKDFAGLFDARPEHPALRSPPMSEKSLHDSSKQRVAAVGR